MNRRTIGWMLVAVQALMLVVLLILPLRPCTPPWLVVGGLLFIGGVAIGILALRQLGPALTPTPVPKPAADLQTEGIYHWARHPIYSSVMVLTLGLVVAAGSAWSLCWWVLLVCFFAIKSRWEDTLLAEGHGQAWLDWAEKTGPFFPHLPRAITRGLLITLTVIVWSSSFWTGFTFQQTYAESDGEPKEVIIATWMRDNNMGPVVAQLENLYYTYINTPQIGGQPTVSADLTAEDSAGVEPMQPVPSASAQATVAPEVKHLDPPPPIISPASMPEPKEGLWQPVGSHVAGIPAIYVTRVRADDVHTSYFASAMWIDTTLATAMFIPGYQEPGGPNPFDGALPKEDWPIVLANFNGAFRLADTMAGYYYGGEMVKPLVNGKASTVIYKDGSIKIGKWGHGLQMSDQVQSVRQNLNLIVDKGESKVSSATDNVVWGATTDKESLAWRSAIGQRSDGSIVYVGSPYLSAAGLANTLVGAGVQEAMVLDMNNWWTAGFYFRHRKDGSTLCRKLDPSIAESCDRFLLPYKRDSYQFLANQPVSP